ncbi:MAG: hypothetical protein LBK26_01000 [Rickettsiales bacterium]|jgi:hypothetical protein|nr:hypothetical protein [Rickettsiales bacterium]
MKKFLLALALLSLTASPKLAAQNLNQNKSKKTSSLNLSPTGFSGKTNDNGYEYGGRIDVLNSYSLGNAEKFSTDLSLGGRIGLGERQEFSVLNYPDGRFFVGYKTGLYGEIASLLKLNANYGNIVGCGVGAGIGYRYFMSNIEGITRTQLSVPVEFEVVLNPKGQIPISPFFGVSKNFGSAIDGKQNTENIMYPGGNLKGTLLFAGLRFHLY